MALAAGAAIVGAIGYVWWPNGDYQPIRPGESGTVGEALTGMRDAPTGRPSFTTDYEQRFGTWAKEIDQTLKAAGGDVRYTEIIGGEHNVWDLTYASPQFRDWLFAQRRGKATP